MGGGAMGPHVGNLAWSLAGSDAARWVYIPTALREEQIPGAQPPPFARRARPPVKTLHTRDRSAADSVAFTAPLDEATAVFIEGGRQWRLADAYLDTRTEAKLHEVLARGGVIVGVSAGASIMASFLVRGSPMGNGIMMSPRHERGFGFVTHCAIDQHVVRRGRQSDLAQVVAQHPELLGIGLDEGAAALVRGDTLTVVNDRQVLITDGADHGGSSFYPIGHGARFDLAKWQEIPDQAPLD